MSKKKPTHIGRYKILGELGRGAMGIVYRAEDPALDRVVALKTIILSDDTDGRKEYQKRFALEARAAGKLTHPNIVTTFDFGQEADLAYMAMELLEGTDLRERLLKGALPTAEAVDIAVQIADGLGFAHERGVVHRDIKPGNIMLLERGGAKIMDFGIARMRTEDFKTSTGFVMGTPRFMSPEQIAGEPVDQRSDLFSLGVVLYEMLTGKMLFAGEGSPQIAHNLANIEHEPASRHNPEVTSLLDFIVARALKKDPAVRYQDAYELAADLRTCLAELGGSVQAAKGSDTIRTVKLAPKDKDKKKDNNRNDKDDNKNSSSPAAVAIAATTRLQLARQFDSSAALKRLAAPGKRDLKLLSRVPRPVGFIRRVCSDAAPRMLFSAIVIAAAASSYIVFG